MLLQQQHNVQMLSLSKRKIIFHCQSVRMEGKEEIYFISVTGWGKSFSRILGQIFLFLNTSFGLNSTSPCAKKKSKILKLARIVATDVCNIITSG
jgi:hypothetical protein